MPYRIKLPSKKASVDEEHLISWMERLWLAVEENRRGILAGLAVVLVSVGIVAGVVWYDHRQSEQALAIDEEAMRFYTNRPADNPEQAAKNLEQAIKRYRRVVKEFPRSPVAPHSLYRLGLALEQDNQLDGAIQAYEDFVSRYGNNRPLLGLVYQRLAYAQLTKGDQEKATQALTSVLAVPGALNQDHALFELGKLEEAQSRPEGALAHYQELVSNYPSSPFANEASLRIKALEAKEEKPAGEAGGEEAEKAPAVKSEK